MEDPTELADTLLQRVLPLVGKPARYLGGELGATAGDRWRPGGVNILLCFPDAYEVGMSHTGLRILYTLLNSRPDTFCDLAFAPWPDMEQAMRCEGLPLFGLQSRRPARQFDAIGFSLGYELGFTNMLTMLDLAGVALRSAGRGDGDPVVVAGGACAFNPAVIGPFCDAVLVGDGEQTVLDLAGALAGVRAAGGGREAALAAVRALPGAWHPGVAEPVRARILADLDTLPPPAPLLPLIEPVHDRLSVEVMRGCARGCRFCQAGMVQRPVRERGAGRVVDAAVGGAAGTGHFEVGLLSLSTSDYRGLAPVVAGIQDALAGSRTNLVLPSLRVDAVDRDLYARLSRERPASFTFAPEAGTQRLRDVINKRVTEKDVVSTAQQAFAGGVKKLKLYFMIGLPTETTADLDGLVALVGRLVGVAPRGGSQIVVSISPFAPKAHTPFQWAGQIPREEMQRRNQYLARRLRRLKVKVSLREPEVSFLEGVLGLGDARLADVVETAWREGARFDAWDESFDFGIWERALAATGVRGEDYVQPRDVAAPLPWDTVLAPVDRDFLAREWERAQAGETTADCRLEGDCVDCAACGDGLGHVDADLTTPAAALRDLPARPPRSARPAPPPADEDPRWRRWREQAAAKIWCRVEFAKTGPMVFLGHLDFQRQFQLALRRSGLPVAYSKGYHPHPLLKFGPPLAVGVAGEREVLDLALLWEPAGWVAQLDRVLPQGLAIRGAAMVGAITPPSIDAAVERFDYRITLPPPGAGGPAPEVARDAVARFLEAESWPWLKRRPRGDVEIDARGLVETGGLFWDRESGGSAPGRVLQLRLRRDTEGAGLPVHEFLAALFGEALPEPRFCTVVRTGILGTDEHGRWLSPLDEIRDRRQRVWLRAHIEG